MDHLKQENIMSFQSTTFEFKYKQKIDSIIFNMLLLSKIFN